MAALRLRLRPQNEEKIIPKRRFSSSNDHSNKPYPVVIFFLRVLVHRPILRGFRVLDKLLVSGFYHSLNMVFKQSNGTFWDVLVNVLAKVERLLEFTSLVTPSRSLGENFQDPSSVFDNI